MLQDEFHCPTAGFNHSRLDFSWSLLNLQDPGKASLWRIAKALWNLCKCEAKEQNTWNMNLTVFIGTIHGEKKTKTQNLMLVSLKADIK
jgi:hypothetical protein